MSAQALISTISTKMGFTLLEVLISLSMLATMSAIAAHLYSQQIAHSQMD